MEILLYLTFDLEMLRSNLGNSARISSKSLLVGETARRLTEGTVLIFHILMMKRARSACRKFRQQQLRESRRGPYGVPSRPEAVDPPLLLLPLRISLQ